VADGRGVGGLHLGVDLGAVHLDDAGRFDPQPYGVAADVEDDHPDLVADHNALAGATRENEHAGLPPWTP
jgi:hypothetical protein